jgi:beta-glucanase (GH16 family)
MYPEQETYGPWPRSGEIDIAHIRGNSPETYPNGRDTVNSYLHWGVADDLDESAKTSGKLTLRRQDLSEGFHTYGMEWSGQHFFTWIDDRAYRVEQTGFGASFGGDMYQRAGYGNEWINGKL